MYDSKSRLSDKMGRTGCADVEYGADCTGASGKFIQEIGWEEFTDAAILALNSQDRPIVFLTVGSTCTEKGEDAD